MIQTAVQQGVGRQPGKYAFMTIPLLLISLSLVIVWLLVDTYDVKPVFLKTDILLFVLVAAVLFFIFYARHREHLHAPWRQVFHSRVGMISLVILSAYVGIALMDSLHFRLPAQNHEENGKLFHSVEVLSVLDLVLKPLRTHDEKTYSAPFSAYLYARETVEMPDGSQQRIYPRLAFGGSHLADPAKDHGVDILARTLRGLISGVVLSAFVVTVVVVLLAKTRHTPPATVWRQLRAAGDGIPWLSILLTVSLLLVCISVATSLAAEYHVFGTDKVGQDVFYQTLKSIRTALAIGTLTTLIMLPFAVLLGIMAGYFRGRVDDVIQYLYMTLSSIPGVLLIAAAILLLQVYMEDHAQQFATDSERADLRLLFLCLILGITSWTGLCRMLRGETMKLSGVEYIQAADAFGVHRARIIMRHILPNVMHIVLISIVLDFSSLVLSEAVLSYIGVGVDPSMYSWGNMINSARLEMAREPMVWWSLMAAFFFMLGLVLAANLFSDAVRDAFDPRLRKG